MKQTDLVRQVREGNIDSLLEQLFTGVPFAFSNAGEYKNFQGQLGAAFNINPADVVLVGSGRFGFSLAPHKFGRPFDYRSDLDLVMVGAELFDAAWLELIRYDFKSLSVSSDVATSLWEHRNNNVFWGYLEPYRLKTALSFYRKTWFPTFSLLNLSRAAAGRTVKARIYRTWEHAKNYHRFGFRVLAAGQKSEAQ